jgi:hypothetical protein
MTPSESKLVSLKGRAMFRKLITTAALALGLTGAALVPADAGGFRGGFGGFRGFHSGFGGGFHPGFRGGFHPGFAGGFRHRGFARGFGYGLGALGAGLAVAPFAYAGAYPYDDSYDNSYYGYTGYCYLQREWLWNGYRYVNQLVRVCQ